ncbi:hypothetical protein GPECTOR_9g675 [Gonium pectorale]|uniref:Protein kinase domain-containing protein n=1 Tax=Gonium pectorale TaxID=33097 RepID=A0A150GTF2_GONPE|nr:hypothetical protein GPECTOR_9g675 [Gonium pectorale]|eukprot:KXZ52630.1 hypothetical protein GPECTOR_9g675 [Gonium pectorale]
MLVLRDVVISTPSCRELPLHQALLCGSAPSPHFIVTPGFLWLSHWSTPALEARNVTVTCSGPVGPHPCVSVVATSGQDVVNALALLQTPSYPLAELYIYIANDITLAGTAVPVCGSAVEAAGSSIPAAAFTGGTTAVSHSDAAANVVIDGADSTSAEQPCAISIHSALRQPIPLTQSMVVITGGSTLPSAVAIALKAYDDAPMGAYGRPPPSANGSSSGGGAAGTTSDKQQSPVLDVGGAVYLIKFITVGSGGRVEIHNLTLTGLPLGPPASYPLGFLRAFLRFMSVNLVAYGALEDRLLVEGVVVHLEPEEVSFWIATVITSEPAVVLGDPAGPRLLNLSARPALINLRSPIASLTLRDLVLVEPPPAGLHPEADATRPTGLPRAFLDGVVLLVPHQELLLLAWVAAHNSTAIVTDQWVAQELGAMARDSELLRPDLGVVYAGKWRGLDVAVKSILLRTPLAGLDVRSHGSPVDVGLEQDAGGCRAEGDLWNVRPGLLPQVEMRRLIAKLCDFGLSHRLCARGPDGDLTHVTGPQRRSSLYSAPELVRYGHSGYKQDVYAYGVLLWELACGLPLPDLLDGPMGRPAREWLRGQAAPGAVVRAVPKELLAWPEGTPRGIIALAERCLQEQPTERPASWELCAALERMTC